MRYKVTAVTIGASVVISSLQILVQTATWHALQPGSPELTYGQVNVPYFRVVPTLAFRFPWTLFTAALAETRFISTILYTCLLGIACRYFEQAWGPRSLAKYVALCSVAPVAGAWIIDLVMYAVTGSPRFSARSIGGGASLAMACLVAFKQTIPLHRLVFFKGTLTVPVKYLPMPALILYTFFGLLYDYTVLVLAWAGFILSWWYLRFVKSIISDPMPAGVEPTVLKGDKSDAFAFCKFFYPYPVTLTVLEASERVFDVLARAGLVARYQQEQVEASNQRVQNSDFNANRRRVLGQELLGA